MKLIKSRRAAPVGALELLHDEFGKLFDFSWAAFPSLSQELRVPSIDISEDKDNIYVEADVPGFKEKDVKLNIKNDILTLSTEKTEEKEENKKNYYHSERFQGNVYRQIALPQAVDRAQAAATYKEGVLKITLPKKEKKGEEEIKINVN